MYLHIRKDDIFESPRVFYTLELKKKNSYSSNTADTDFFQNNSNGEKMAPENRSSFRSISRYNENRRRRRLPQQMRRNGTRAPITVFHSPGLIGKCASSVILRRSIRRQFFGVLWGGGSLQNDRWKRVVLTLFKVNGICNGMGRVQRRNDKGPLLVGIGIVTHVIVGFTLS